MRARWSGLLLAAAGAFATLEPSCSVYDDSLLLGDAGGSGGSSAADCLLGDCWWSEGSSAACRSVSAPGPSQRPSAASNADVGEIVLGVERFYIGESVPPGAVQDPNADPLAQEPWQSFGLDQDGVCTNPVSCPDVTDAEVGCKTTSPALPFDGVGCRDNMFANLERTAASDPDIGIPNGINENAFNCGFHRGSFNVLFRVTKYNGELNDDTVRVDMYPSSGLQDNPAPWNCEVESKSWQNQPKWLAAQRWFVDDSVLTAPVVAGQPYPNSTISDPAAYVRDGYLVVAFPNGETLRFPGDNSTYPGFSLKINHGVVVGRLLKQPSGLWELRDGLIAGRVNQNDLENSFRYIGVCPDNPKYDTIITYLNSNMDVLTNGSNSPAANCDAMSMGIAFEARGVTLGDAVAVAPLVDNCMP